jgi:hypothetical protein
MTTMNRNEQEYINTLRKSVYDRISAEINDETIDLIVQKDLVKSHLKNKASVSFQKYYFSILSNKRHCTASVDFFRQFKRRYSLQGIDSRYLDKLEGRKKEILKNIRSGRLAKLYFDIFHKANIKHGKYYKAKSLGSFFAKLVHTFRPDEYCALDNPIKNYFGLSKESFFVSFCIISAEYKRWSLNNNTQMNIIREKFEQADKNNLLEHHKLTDLKILDLIFWSKANTKLKRIRNKKRLSHHEGQRT